MVDKKKDKIIIFGNIKNDIIKGTNIFTSVKVFTSITSTILDNYLNIYNIENFKNDNSYNRILDSKIILSARLLETNDTLEKSIRDNVTLITQHQLFNNIKYIYKNNDFSKPRIIFLNNKNINIQKNRYLFKDITTDEGRSFITLGNTDIATKDFDNTNTPFLHIGFNLYNLYKKSDYYKIKFNDFLYKNLRERQNIYDSNLNTDNIEYTFIDMSLNNDFSNNNLINYDENKFKTLFYQVDGSLNNVQTLDKPHTINNSNNDNIYIYNKYENTTTIDICYNVSESPINYNLKINFEIIKKRNTISPYYGKILIHNDFININGYVLGENTNFFDICINDFDNIKDHSDLSNQNKIFLSLGNGITGITQKNINNSIIFKKNSDSINETKIFNNKIIFKNLDVNRSSNILKEYYLLDNSYNYNYTNTLYFQENTPIDNTTQLFKKKFDISLIDYFNVSDFSNSFNSLEILDNYLLYNHFDISYNNSNIFFKVDNNNDIYLYDTNFEPYNDFSLKIDICGLSPNYENYENIFEFGNSDDSNKITNKLFYDFRYNYSKKAYFVAYFDIKYQLSGDEIFNTQLNDFSNNLLLNFNKLVITNYFITSTGSDFTNVDCIFEYYNPDDPNTPDEFKYPNNNIKIIRDVNIDTLSKAIELLPNARTGTSNSIFIPAKNGSNLSRKMIQGLIGMNNIPKLLSIKPYDPNVINNRGFNNQLNFQGGTLSADELKLTDKDRVSLKYESQKHSLQKNIITTSRKNFASLVRQPSRSRNVNLTQTVQNCPTGVSNVNINQYITPFKLFKTGRGSYLNSGK